MSTAEYQAKWQKSHQKEWTAYNTKKMREYRKLRAEQGLCTMCGARKAVLNGKTCQVCLDRGKAYRASKQLHNLKTGDFFIKPPPSD